jgi:hypothetical protein
MPLLPLRIEEPFRPRVGARFVQGRGLRLATAFGHSFREIREKQGDPEPERTFRTTLVSWIPLAVRSQALHRVSSREAGLYYSVHK